MNNNIYIYILLMTLTVYLIRVLPLTLIRKPIKNKLIKDFLYYVPYVTLSVMSFPAIVYATNNIYSGIAALVVGIISSYYDLGLFKVTLICCVCVFLIELLIKF